MTTVEEAERESLQTFVQSCVKDLSGTVLDYGCGHQPYRRVVEEAGGTYLPWNRKSHPGAFGSEDHGPMTPFTRYYDTILFTQVLQYVPLHLIPGLLASMWAHTEVLVITWPTNWPEVNDTDLHRFTASGLTDLLSRAGFRIRRLERRGSFHCDGWSLAFGYGAVADAG